MKPFLIILITLFAITAIGQQPEYPDSGFTNKAEAKNLMVNGLKEGKWIEYLSERGQSITDTNLAIYYCLIVYKASKKNGTVECYYRDGKLRYINYYKNDTACGVWKGFYENGNIKHETPVVNGSANGIIKAYYESGKLKSETICTNGIDGKAKNYDENGNEIKQ